MINDVCTMKFSDHCVRWYAGRSHPQGGSVPLTNTVAPHPPPAHTEQASEDLTHRNRVISHSRKKHLIFGSPDVYDHNIVPFLTFY